MGTGLGMEQQANREEATIQIANEFAFVLVRKVHTTEGERVEVEAPRIGRKILLDPSELETISWQDTETFSEFLADPFGPIDTQ